MNDLVFLTTLDLTLTIKCYDLSVIFDVYKKLGVRSIVLMTGTLDSMEELRDEHGSFFQIERRFGHVVDIQKRFYPRLIGSYSLQPKFKLGHPVSAQVVKKI